MNTYIEKVKEFHENFDHPISDQKDDISLKIRQLRVKLLFEELKELAEASDVRKTFVDLCENSGVGSYQNVGVAEVDGNNVNKKEELDALCDIQYVLSGAILALGFHNEFDEAFAEVHSSNMSKMCNNLKEVEDTMRDYKEKDGTECHYIQKGDKYMVLRKGDNKILKSSYYTPASLTGYIR